MLVVGRWRVALSTIGREGPALDMGQQDRHRHVRDLGAARRALPSLLLVHNPNLATTTPAFHRVSTIPITLPIQWLTARNSGSGLSSGDLDTAKGARATLQAAMPLDDDRPADAAAFVATLYGLRRLSPRDWRRADSVG